MDQFRIQLRSSLYRTKNLKMRTSTLTKRIWTPPSLQSIMTRTTTMPITMTTIPSIGIKAPKTHQNILGSLATSLTTFLQLNFACAEQLSLGMKNYNLAEMSKNEKMKKLKRTKSTSTGSAGHITRKRAIIFLCPWCGSVYKNTRYQSTSTQWRSTMQSGL